MISIIDYGAGNLFSVKNALDYLGIDSKITSDNDEITRSDAIILPGVGAFPSAMVMLNQRGLIPLLKEQAKLKPFLGICLGMQILFEKGYEFSETDGLGLIEGSVIKINAPSLKIPHMGWNSVTKNVPCALTNGITDSDYVYFVHSFRAETPPENVALYTNYGEDIPALVVKGNVYGCQFHPEKSSEVGLNILKNFWELTK